MGSHRKILFTIVLCALLARAGMLYCNYIRHPGFFARDAAEIAREISPAQAPYVNPFGFEIGNIAYSIVCGGRGFSSPFGGDTGPTGWAAPGAVMLYALAFSLFGCFSNGALLFMFALALVLSAAMMLIIHSLSFQLFRNRTIALIGTACFAFSLQDLELYSKSYQQDFNIYSFVFLVLFALLLRYQCNRSRKNLIFFALGTGVALHFLPVLTVAIAVVWALQVVVEKEQRRLQVLKHALVFCLVTGCVAAPYTLYQQQRIGTLFFMKSNGMFELNQGNSPVSDGYLTVEVFAAKHPAQNEAEFDSYKKLGETAYVRSKLVELKKNFDPLRFARLCLNRFCYFFFVFRHITEAFALTHWMLLRYAGYLLPGLALVLFPLLCRPQRPVAFTLLYGYIAGFALPYICIAVMYRYSFPINTLTSILLGAIVYQVAVCLQGHRRDAFTVPR